MRTSSRSICLRARTTVRDRPVVGLLHNPAVPIVIESAGSLVEAVEVIPERLWYDFGRGMPDRFHRVSTPLSILRQCLEGRLSLGHGIGLSLPTAMPLDEELVEEVVATAVDLGFAWYSEHLSTFLVPGGG